ncbi:MAG TPA: hypothetical protein VMB25_02580 [Bryobacteraceae bacterium]|nr:hypothetical protein [Bryobacteraceae bacterium]
MDSSREDFLELFARKWDRDGSLLWVSVRSGPVDFDGLAKLRAVSPDSLELFSPGWDMTIRLEGAVFNVATPDEFPASEDAKDFVCGFTILFPGTGRFVILSELAERSKTE